ncbi:MAG: substrate-binding domain-containing protein [Nostoc sp. ChiSLP02]|nr:substrate-binding domain-containing protein [Nostoc sp. DedSLP05]MDZ8188460.1 substrate-binding domain-containing protein [Nostoc sp. ChiSLP02]
MKKRKIIPLIILFVICPIALLIVNFVNLEQIRTPQNVGSANYHNIPPQTYDRKTFAEVQVPEGTFNYGGSTTWATIRGSIDQKIQDATKRKFKLNYVDHPRGKTPGSITGIRMLLNDKLHFSVSSRPLEPQEKQNLKEIPVAIDGIAIAVNRNLPIESLTIEQIKNIYTGHIKNWNEIVSSPNVPIKPYIRDPRDGGTVEYFLKEVLKIEKIEELGSSVEFVPDTTHGVQKVNQKSGGIYFASAPEVIKECTVKTVPLKQKLEPSFAIPPYRPPLFSPEDCLKYKDKIEANTAAFRNGTYPITRKLFVIVKQNDPIKKEAGESYANLLLTQEGQELLEKIGFAPILNSSNN